MEIACALTAAAYLGVHRHVAGALAAVMNHHFRESLASDREWYDWYKSRWNGKHYRVEGDLFTWSHLVDFLEKNPHK